MMAVMLDIAEKKQLGKRKKSPPNVINEYAGYLGKGNTEKIMSELRGEEEIDADKM